MNPTAEMGVTLVSQPLNPWLFRTGTALLCRWFFSPDPFDPNLFQLFLLKQRFIGLTPDLFDQKLLHHDLGLM